MVTLLCALVGVKGSAFSVDIEASESVDDLKKAIRSKNENTLKAIAASKLQLFLARNADDTWLASSTDDVKKLENGETTALIEALTREDSELDGEFGLEDVLEGMPEPKTKQMLVIVAHHLEGVGTKRVRVDEWFADKSFCVQKKKRKVNEDEPDQFTRYFTMAEFPPLAHPMQKYSKIMERDAYAVIFTELMGKVKWCFEAKSGANMVVTGNPGTGMSRFYLYCIFQLVRANQEQVKEVGRFNLVFNSEDTFHIYAAESNEFVELNMDQVCEICEQRRVLRLIEGTSSQLTGWRGVSILFASSGLRGMNNYAKVDSFTYILPVWSLEELQDYNSLLDDGLKLADDVLLSRYDKCGGIPRYIFTVTERENDVELKRAIATFGALDILAYAKKNHAVRDGDYSHRVFKMVPRRADFRAKFHLEFLSNTIAERIVANADEEILHRAIATALAKDGSGSMSVVRGRIHEMLCHRWFNLHKQARAPFVAFHGTHEIDRSGKHGNGAVLHSRRDSRSSSMHDVLPADVKNIRCVGRIHLGWQEHQMLRLADALQPGTWNQSCAIE